MYDVNFLQGKMLLEFDSCPLQEGWLFCKGKSYPLRGDFLAPNENRFLGPINSLRLKFKTQGNNLSLINNSRKNNENTDSLDIFLLVAFLVNET